MNDSLRVYVIEDNADTRTLIKNNLVALRIGNIESFPNGAHLLREKNVVNADIIMIGMDLENSYGGIDLIRHLARLKKLQPWTKVIFVTSRAQKVKADLPLLGQKCEVIAKPLNFPLLNDIVLNSIEQCKMCRKVFLQIDSMSDQALVELVKELPAKARKTGDIDSIRLMQCKLLLKLRRPAIIFNIVEAIEDDELRHLALMHYALYFGQTDKLKRALESLRMEGLLATKRQNFEILQCIVSKQYNTALSVMEKHKDADLLPLDVIMKASLIALSSNVEKAIEYLEGKRGTSLENHYYRSVVTVTMMYLCMMQLVVLGEQRAEHDEWLKKVEKFTQEASLSAPGNDYHSFVPFIRLACKVLTDKYKDKTEELNSEIAQLLEETVNLEPLKRLCLAMVYAHNSEYAHVIEQLANVAKQHADTEVSPELVANYLVYDLFLEHVIPEKDRAPLLNKLGKQLFEERFPAAAIRLFYRSFKLSPDFHNNTINLLSALKTTHLKQYNDVNFDALFNEMGRTNLPAKQVAALRQIQDI